MLQPTTPSRSGRPAAPAYAGAAKRQAPRVPHTHAHRWLGPFCCATEACGTILGEIFTDAAGTYLANIGGRPVRSAAIECPACGATRQFVSRPAANPAPAAPIVLNDKSGYDLGNRDAEPSRSDGPPPSATP